MINAGFLNCPVEISVDNHTISVISSDGEDINPVEGKKLKTFKKTLVIINNNWFYGGTY